MRTAPVGWVMPCIDQLLQDARDALRTLRRRPAFSVVVVLTLALGISMTTAVFSVFNAVVLRPVAYPNPERLLWLSTVDNEAEPGSAPPLPSQVIRASRCGGGEHFDARLRVDPASGC